MCEDKFYFIATENQFYLSSNKIDSVDLFRRVPASILHKKNSSGRLNLFAAEIASGIQGRLEI